MKNALSGRTITILGPFATEYSLAKVNRNFARALALDNPNAKVQLWAEPQYVDRMPEPADLVRYPFLKELITYEKPDTDILIYNSFPKNIYSPYGFKDMPGKVKLAYIAWEESVFPKRWVTECNQYLHGILTPSEHVSKVFRASGITVPIKVISEGLDIPLTRVENYPMHTKKKFKFFHVSSGQYRKGVDLLLQAYMNEFKAGDDICLVLKLFPNASMDKQIDELLAKRTPDSPEIEMIKTDKISDGQLRSLYEQCTAFVQPSRAEGFGLPMAEAMFLGKPLITTGWSGQMQFCDQANSFLIDYKLVDSKSHLNIPGAKVAEPDLADLQNKLRFVYQNIDGAKVQHTIVLAKQRAAELTWERTAQIATPFIDLIEHLAPLKHKKMAVVTTMNSRCGVAEYSKGMYSPVISAFKDFKFFANSDIGDRTAPDSHQVERCWIYGEPNFDALMQAVSIFQPDFLHFQYNLSFYSPLLLNHAVALAKSKGIKTFVTLHSIHPSLKQSVAGLNVADSVYVHSADDLASLVSWGLTNGQLVDHGLVPFADEDQQTLAKKLGVDNTTILAAHGMIHEKKGLLELLEAVKLLKEEFPMLLLLSLTPVNLNNSSSAAVFARMQEYVKTNQLQDNVVFISEFLKLAEVIKILHLAQLVVLPYGDVVEGASGAVRTVIGSRRPIITSDAYIFRNLPLGLKVKGNSPAAIAAGIQKLLNDPELYSRIKSEVNEYADLHNWETVSYQYLSNLAAAFCVD